MVRVRTVTDPAHDRNPVIWMLLLALLACVLTLLIGLVGAVVYTRYEPLLRSMGVTFQQLRPIHETYAFAWVFLGGVTVIHFFLLTTFGPFEPAARRRFRAQCVLWAAAGAGTFITLSIGQFTGREYLGYHPIFSLIILAGWLLFARNYFGLVGFRLRGRPVYIYMWSVAIPLFVVTYLEGHLYLLEQVSAQPVRDIALQWKSNGVMVGSFNLLAYGSLMYIAGLIRKDDGYSYSRTAFGLFTVGVLNTFTNYGHHTYHLPQTPWIHWIAFVVSMLETIILAKVLFDLLGLRRAPSMPDDLRVPERFVRAAMLWTFLMLLLSLLIAIPPLNAFIHGTHVVVAHSMGSMLGINSMILLGAFAYAMRSLKGAEHPVVKGARVRSAVPWVNLFLGVFWLAFLARGLAAAMVRYLGPSAPDYSLVVQAFPPVVLISGAGLVLSLLWIFSQWVLALWRPVPLQDSSSAP
ncbi:MAG: cbb3-type cytochrome c oxidase subunit I [Acidobacteriota bacterium]